MHIFGHRSARVYLIHALYLLSILIAVVVVAKDEVSALGRQDDEVSSPGSTLSNKKMEAEKRRQTRRVYSLLDHSIRICVYTFVSAVFAGLTLGVMCADTFTLEVIAESGPKPDCKYAATILPLRRQGHKTLCTLIISNMLCNVLIVQEFADVFDIVQAIRSNGNASNVVDDSGSALVKFAVSTFVIVIFAEIVPMSICKSKYSLKVAAAGSIFVRIAMVLTYPISMPLGKFLDWVVGNEEAGQIFDRNELRRLMVIHYEREGEDAGMPKTELNLLLAAMDFQDLKVRDIMTPIDEVAHVNETDAITSDFLAHLWLSGRSRVPVMSTSGEFHDVLVVKDLLTINTHGGAGHSGPLTVAQVVQAKNRLFAMVGENNTLPSMMRFFQEAKTHMAVVYAEDSAAENLDSSVTLPLGLSKSFAGIPHSGKAVGIVTMEDVVEQLLNDEIYDEYDRYDPVSSSPTSPNENSTTVDGPQAALSHSSHHHFPTEPAKPPRVNFYSYFTHPENPTPLTDPQVWAVAYFLNRSVRAFMLWPPGCTKLLLDSCMDQQLVVPAADGSSSSSTLHHPLDHQGYLLGVASAETASSAPSGSVSMSPTTNSGQHHVRFLGQAPEDRFVLYTRGRQTNMFTLILGGTVDVLVGGEGFHTAAKSFQYFGEDALTAQAYIPDYSAVVTSAARVYCISQEKYQAHKVMHEQHQRRHMLPSSPRSLERLRRFSPNRSRSSAINSERQALLSRPFSYSGLDSRGTDNNNNNNSNNCSTHAYGTFGKDE